MGSEKGRTVGRAHEAMRESRAAMGEAAGAFIELRRALGNPQGQARAALDAMALSIQRATSALGMGVALTDDYGDSPDDADERAERYASVLEEAW